MIIIFFFNYLLNIFQENLNILFEKLIGLLLNFFYDMIKMYDEDDFEKDQERKIIDSFNEQQKTYYISSKIELNSKNPVYIAYRRIFRSQFQNNENNLNQENVMCNNDNDNYKDIDDIRYDNKKIFALKLLKYYTKKQIKAFDREKNVLDLFLDDPEIIKYLEIIPVIMYNRKHILVSMHFYPHVDLLFYLWRPLFQFDENFICLIAFKALKILILLKSRGVVHNDIKFENFIVSSENPFEIILTDFESAEMVINNGKSNLFSGTTIYKAPEVLRGEEHDYSSDIWSLGVNLYYHLFFEYPFGIKIEENYVDCEEIIQNKISYGQLIRPENNDEINVSDEAWSCVSAMLEKNPQNRINAEDVIHHVWFSFLESDLVKSQASKYDFDQCFDDEIESPSV